MEQIVWDVNSNSAITSTIQVTGGRRKGIRVKSLQSSNTFRFCLSDQFFYSYYRVERSPKNCWSKRLFTSLNCSNAPETVAPYRLAYPSPYLHTKWNTPSHIPTISCSGEQRLQPITQSYAHLGCKVKGTYSILMNDRIVWYNACRFTVRTLCCQNVMSRVGRRATRHVCETETVWRQTIILPHTNLISVQLLQHSMGHNIKSLASFCLSICYHFYGCNLYSILMKCCTEVRRPKIRKLLLGLKSDDPMTYFANFSPL